MTEHEPHGSWVRSPRIGLPLPAVFALALLAAPRVVLHDLDVIEEGTFVNALFVFIPPLIWIGIAVLRKIHRPILTLFVVGVFYGVLLAVGHQILWNINSDDPVMLGGNLADIDPDVQTVIIRVFAAISSVVTGTFVGVAAGLVAWALIKTRSRSTNDSSGAHDTTS
ncbi:hypothetical protein [Haloechinothrix halophila]|uniref:hypothetical protein n=1 Tax=Haloechinothrix halophila TaxID=1069073 RepID=UPI0006845FB2|nr:hypothetical protein [Haloechinothrix halophila]